MSANLPEAWKDWCGAPDDVDALYVYSAEVALEGAEAWQERYDYLRKDEWSPPSTDEEDMCDSHAYYALPGECWLVPIAPDVWHKYDISGCGACEIATSNLAADARLLTERRRTTFVNYLRICFH